MTRLAVIVIIAATMGCVAAGSVRQDRVAQAEQWAAAVQAWWAPAERPPTIVVMRSMTGLGIWSAHVGGVYKCAGVGFRPTVYLLARVANEASEDAWAALVAHELGHHVLRHCRATPEAEAAADVESVRLLIKVMGWDEARAVNLIAGVVYSRFSLDGPMGAHDPCLSWAALRTWWPAYNWGHYYVPCTR